MAKVNKDISITFSVSKPIKTAIDDICDKVGCSQSAVMRAALHMYLSEHHPHGTFLNWMEEPNVMRVNRSVLDQGAKYASK